jgi:phenylacetate-CoA ligase
LPAVLVEGRCDDVLTLHDAAGHAVPLVPLAITTVVEEAAHVHRFQVVQTGRAALGLRLLAGERAGAAAPALAALRHYLDRQGLPHVRVALDAAEPCADARDGKLRQVVSLPTA